jgi:hypothetical protein
MKTVPFSVYEFRPLPQNMVGQVYRYAEGKWIEDDGEYDLAFAMPNDCMAYYVNLPYKTNLRWSWNGGNYSKHPQYSDGYRNPWHYELKNCSKHFMSWKERDQHPNEVAGRSAMNFVCNLRRCANGRGPELFHIDDSYTKAGLLRERDSKKVLEFPKTMNCIYCGIITTNNETKLR